MELSEILYEVSFRNVKYPRLEFTTGKLLLILPYGYSPKTVLEKHKSWITKKLGFINECLKESYKIEIHQREKKELEELVSSLIKKISMELNVRIKKVFWREMKTKWASLSKKGNLTVNVLINKLPSHLIEYIVYHELTHLIEKRHNENFWRVIHRKFENYRELEKELFIYWFAIQKAK